ncbi:HK97 family phage prohead protease [Campylobacter peloridis]|uniref:HK97 family phage prohead protease n=1 Tax=Campylobacter peloridis TaxID=488546 RepID=UPI001C738B56|nr:HK97 family phage prohead protease [Campylobacter peloridis]MBX2078023.1 HK97 family phage prohead protease [Campylobacter peloridis]
MNFIRSDTAKIRNIDNDNNILSFVMISNSNACKRWDWDMGEYLEELDISGARYNELRTLFTDHNPSVDNAIAKIENIRVENNELVCDCIFAKDERSQNIFKKYKDGILSDVSIGYKILKQTIDKDSNLKKVLVNEFEIFELSAVWKGADKNAKKRFFDEQTQKEAKALAQARERELELMIKTL